jgi:hypothetical protein
MKPAFGNPPVAARPAPTQVVPGAKPPAAQPANPGVTPAIAPPVTSPTIFGNGTGGAFRGLAYVLSPDTKRIPDLTQMTPFATLFTDSFQVKPQPFTGGFPGALMQEDWFAIRYEGLFNVPSDGAYMFKIMANRGAQLSIDGVVVLDAQAGGPGSYLPTGFTLAGNATLKQGVHKLRLDYMQAEKGSVTLELFMDPAKSGAQAATPLVGTTPAGAANQAGGAVPAGGNVPGGAVPGGNVPNVPGGPNVSGRGIPAAPGMRPQPGTK